MAIKAKGLEAPHADAVIVAVPRELVENISEGWIWNHESAEWVVIGGERKKSASRKLRVVENFEYANDRFQVVCHSKENVLWGHIASADQSHCTLVSHQPHLMPAFGLGSNVFLDILDTKGNQAVLVKAKIEKVEKLVKGWKFFFQWGEIPALLQGS